MVWLEALIIVAFSILILGWQDVRSPTKRAFFLSAFLADGNEPTGFGASRGGGDHFPSLMAFAFFDQLPG